MLDKALRLSVRIPGLYALLAFLTAKRAVIRGWSMYPALLPGDRVLFDRLSYRLGPPHRGDVVLASHPARPRRLMVKRLAAVPGDDIIIEGERCWVNGVPFGVEMSPDGAAPPGEPRPLAENEYLLLGDAPDFSTDGRHLGPVSRESIKARSWLVYWPPQRIRVVKGAKESKGQLRPFKPGS